MASPRRRSYGRKSAATDGSLRLLAVRAAQDRTGRQLERKFQWGSVESVPEELPAAIERTTELDPVAGRARVAEQFDASGMVKGYEAIYRRALDSSGERFCRCRL